MCSKTHCKNNTTAKSQTGINTTACKTKDMINRKKKGK
jgi:hypothetical protein